MVISAEKMATGELQAYRNMMIEVMSKVERIAPLSLHVLSDVLKELDQRGEIRLVSGSYGDPLNAMIRNRP